MANRRLHAESISTQRSLTELFQQAMPYATRAAEVRFANIHLGSPELELDDLKQDVLLSVWQTINRFCETRASLRTFVEIVAKNRVASITRRTRAMKRREVPAAKTTDSNTFVVSMELRIDIGRMRRQLRPRDQAVALLLMDYSPAKVARILSISRTEVYRSIERIHAVLFGGGYK